MTEIDFIPTTKSLTSKQFEMLVLVAEGLTGKEIAHRLGISYSATSQRIETLRQKFGGITKYEMARQARQMLFASDDPELRDCIKDTGDKFHLPNQLFGDDDARRNQAESELTFADSMPLRVTAPWEGIEADSLVPKVLDGENAVPARWAFVVITAIGIAILLLVLFAVADTIGDLV